MNIFQGLNSFEFLMCFSGLILLIVGRIIYLKDYRNERNEK